MKSVRFKVKIKTKMDNVLAIDIGNTNITIGLFKNNRLAGKAKLPTDKPGLLSSILWGSWLKWDGVNNIIISSVVPEALSKLKKNLNKIARCKISVVGSDAKVPIRNLYKAKREVGQDRLVNAFAAKTLYGSPAVIIDFGTAITFDIVSVKGEYLGGLILPGIEMGLSALYERTALLPKIELKPALSIIGKDTVDSMRGGILFGYGAMCDGLVSKYRVRLGRNTKVIATGGNAGLIKRYAKSIQVVDEDITLKGLSLIAAESRKVF